MTIHKEGRLFLFVLLVILAVIYMAVGYYFPDNGDLLDIVTGVSIFIYISILQFFRNPTITINKGDKKILAAADGKVVVVEETNENEYFNEKRIQVSVFMSPVNVHVNRSPMEGLVKYFKYHPGKYLVAWHPKSSTENERTSMVLKHSSGTEILVRQIAGAMARRIKWYTKEGEKLGQGEEFGFIKFGSRVDLFLPLDAKILVKPGDKTKGGRTVIAELA